MNVGNKGGPSPQKPSKALAPRQRAQAPAIPTTQIASTRCKVCNSPYRREIDMCLVTGWSQSAVMKHFNQVMGEEHFNKMNMSRHARYHLDVKDAAVRRIIEARAKQFIGDVDAVEGSILTRAAVLDTVIQRGIEQVNAGIMELKGQDIMSAIQMLDKLEADFKDTAIDEMLNEFKVFAEVVKNEYGEDEFRALWTRFEEKIDAKTRPAIMPVEVQNAEFDFDAEVVGEDEDGSG